jgi:hypothetical protein
MKAAVFAIPFLALSAIPAPAQERTPQERPPQPEIIIGEAPRAPDAPQSDDRRQPGAGGAARGRETGRFERCVDVVIGSEKSFGCLNEKLKLQVDRVNPPVTNTPPLDARSQDIKVGVVNVPAVQEQYGRNFGVSAFPFRPPPPVFSTGSVPTVRR